jgi:hypothetical protein
VEAFENAQRAQKNGHLVFAQKLFLECLVPACPKEVRNDCTEGQANVDRSLATVTIVVRNAAGADVPAKIKIDGAPYTREPGRAMPIDPGTHQLQYTVGGETKLSSVTIVEGEKSRVIVLTPTGEPPAPVPAQATVAQTAAPSRSYIIGPAVVGGLGVLTALAAAGMFVIGSNEASDRDAERAVFNDQTKTDVERNAAAKSSNSHNDAANNAQLFGVILGGSALVMVGVAAAWYLIAKASTSKTAQFSPVITF